MLNTFAKQQKVLKLKSKKNINEFCRVIVALIVVLSDITVGYFCLILLLTF